jgi:glycosyltransferase involved in cell wall biosynthesis
MNELISVVIPCRNEAKAIEATVQAILKSDYPNLEILVVDGMSEDGTRDILARMTQMDSRVRRIDNPKKLTPYAFNLGVKNARGAYVQIVGSRNVMDVSYLSILHFALQSRPDVACVGGDYQHVYDSKQGQHIAMAMESKFGVGGGNYRTMGKDCFVDTVGVPMYRKSIFDEVGYFDEALTRNQDDEFNYRVRQRGYKIMYVHSAKVTYLVRGNLQKAFQQFRQYGYFKVFVNRKHGAVTTLRQLAPALFTGLFALGVPLSIILPALRPLLSSIAFIYVLAGLALAGRGLTLGERLNVLVACVVLHAGYGYGYWQGIWDFFIQKQTLPRAELQRQTT